MPTGRPKRKAAKIKRLKRNETIDGVTINEPFAFSRPKTYSDGAVGYDEEVGEGCYISVQLGAYKYYGILVEHSVVAAATDVLLDNEDRSLKTNERMRDLREQLQVGESFMKKARVGDEMGDSASREKKQVQKFIFLTGDKDGPGSYRDLVATYADASAASEDDPQKELHIEEACKSGGNYVGGYYYQYEVQEKTLQVDSLPREKYDNGTELFKMWSSIDFKTFLKYTPFPQWHPLSNVSGGQKKALQVLNLELNRTGVAWHADSSSRKVAGPSHHSTVTTKVPMSMKPRNHYRIGVIGGGISGLASAYELLRLSLIENIDIEVVLLEARDRFGGRIQTDYDSFKSNGQPFPIDLGASYIQGIDKNPIANLATEAGIEFSSSDDAIKILQGNDKEIDKSVERRVQKIFNDILEKAAGVCWSETDEVKPYSSAMRWYASLLENKNDEDMDLDSALSDVLEHRQSDDIPLDVALSQIFKRAHLHELPNEERNLLMWHMKNLEYSRNANIRDLSTNYWDVSDDYAFKGNHVQLKQGYSSIINYLVDKCKQYPNFIVEMNYVVKKIEYARESSTTPYKHEKRMVPLSDTCSITSTTNKIMNFDFLISTLPLGVLKNRCKESSESEVGNKIIFKPSLPLWKSDSIDSIGFGLLNKIVLQFPFAFWRQNPRDFSRDKCLLDEGQSLIANVSGKNSEHYVFYDLGKCLSDDINTAPPILMTLVSGLDAVIVEQLSKDHLVDCVMETITHLFKHTDVPHPTFSVRTSWGSDPFSRGSYSFLAPGATEEDYLMLQFPINGNSSSNIVDEVDTMRLFWAGEHTTSQYPSTTHGAYLSGLRSAKEVINSMCVKEKANHILETKIPLLYYKLNHPKASLQCHLCCKTGSKSEEGSLLAFQRGNQHTLVHFNCAKFTPSVMGDDGSWRNIFKIVSHAKQVSCSYCKKSGASIGCAKRDCNRWYHYRCCLDTGRSFDENDRRFFCDLHRSEADMREEDEVSLSKEPFENCETDPAEVTKRTQTIMRERAQYVSKGDPRPSLQCAWCGPKIWSNSSTQHAICKACQLLYNDGWRMDDKSDSEFSTSSTENNLRWENYIFRNKNKGVSLRSVKSFLIQTSGYVSAICRNDPEYLNGMDEIMVIPKSKKSGSPNASSDDCATMSSTRGLENSDDEESFNRHRSRKPTSPSKIRHNLFNPPPPKSANLAPTDKTTEPENNPIPSRSIKVAPVKNNDTRHSESKIPVNKKAEPKNNPKPSRSTNVVSVQSNDTQHSESINPTNKTPKNKSTKPLSFNAASSQNNASSQQTNARESKTSSAQKTPKTNKKINKSFTLDPHITDLRLGKLYSMFKNIRATRPSLESTWGIAFSIIEISNTVTLQIPERSERPPLYGLLPEDIILEINGMKIGSNDLHTPREVQKLMKGASELTLLIIRKPVRNSEPILID